MATSSECESVGVESESRRGGGRVPRRLTATPKGHYRSYRDSILINSEIT